MFDKHLVRDYSLFALIALFLLLFLSAILVEKSSHIFFVLSLILAFALLVFGFYHTHKRIVTKPFNILTDIEMIFISVVSAVATSFLNLTVHLGPVIGAATIGVIAGYSLPLFPQDKIKNLAAVAYCGAFVGMTASTRFGNPLLIGLAGGIAGLVFAASQNIFQGCGGKLGTIAFIGTATVMLLIGVAHV